MSFSPSRKPFIMLAILAGLFLLLIIVARVTGSFQVYRLPTSSNEPGLKKGTMVVATNKKVPQFKKYLFYKMFDSTLGQKAVFVFRCMGMPGDHVQMKKGVLYVNGKNADENLDLKHQYHIYSENTERFFELLEDYDRELFFPTPGQATLDLTRSDYHTLRKACVKGKDSIVPIMVPPMEFARFVYEQGHAEWTIDEFGPITIPPKKYFVLGDNRHNAADSRFSGLVAEAEVVGVAF